LGNYCMTILLEIGLTLKDLMLVFWMLPKRMVFSSSIFNELVCFWENLLFVKLLFLLNVILFVFTILNIRQVGLCYQGCHIYLPNMGCMVYFHWTTKRHGQTLGLVEVTLVREMLEWDIHDIP
jgi:hypothetical protein